MYVKPGFDSGYVNFEHFKFLRDYLIFEQSVLDLVVA